MLLVCAVIPCTRAAWQAGLTPLFDGVSHDLTTGQASASFGYVNTNSGSIDVPIGGPTNTFNASYQDAFRNFGQPELFSPGTHHFVFSVGFTPDGYPGGLSWTLGPATVTAPSTGTGNAFVATNLTAGQSSGSQTFSTFEGQAGSTFTLSGGAFNVSTAILDSGATLNLDSGTLSATSSLQSNGGRLVFNGGVLNTPALYNYSGTVDAHAGSTSFLNTFQNAGTLDGTGGNLTLAAFTNPGLGTVTWQSGGFSAPSVVNKGTFSLSGGTVTVTSEFNNYGTGTLTLNGGALSTPQLDNQTDGTIDLKSGAYDGITTLTNQGLFTGDGGNLTLTTDLSNPGAISWSGGTLTAPSITNDGTLSLLGGTVTFTGELNSTGGLLIRGGILSAASLSVLGSFDWTGGTINLTSGNLATDGSSFLGANPSLAAGETLHVTAGITSVGAGGYISVGPGATLITQGGNNAGTFYVTGGAYTSASGVFTNAAGATFYGTNATLTFSGGGGAPPPPMMYMGADGGPSSVGQPPTDGLQNLGTLTLVDSTVNGDVNSPAGSLINIAGSVTFNGFVSGAADIAGSGLATFAGGYAPGDPVLVTAGGGLAFAGTNTLVMQIAGLTRGTGYDAFNVAGALTYGGALQVELINGFTPAAGSTFDLFNYATATGTFSTLSLPALAGGLSWNTAELYTTGVLSVAAVPEPAAWALLAGLAVLSCAFIRRSRTRRRAL